jgi:hypothetical protein
VIFDDEHLQELSDSYNGLVLSVSDLFDTLTHGGEDPITFHSLTGEDGGYVELHSTLRQMTIISRSDRVGTMTVQVSMYPPHHHWGD